MSRDGLRVAVLGCGQIGAKRAQALAPQDTIVGCCDLNIAAAEELAARHGARVCATPQELVALDPDVVVVAAVHDQLAGLVELSLAAGAHVLVEKPAAISTAQIDRLLVCQRISGRLVKVGFNHRFHPGIARAVEEVHSGRHGELMHLLDLTNWIAGPLPLHSALLRTQFWDAEVEDNAALLLGEPGQRTGPWAMLHVSWTEWKNLFSLEIYCHTAKLQIDGLVRSYGPQRLRIYTMGPELGPPALEEIHYSAEDGSWAAEWEHFAEAVVSGDGRALLGDLRSARDAWEQVEAAYETDVYADMRSLATLR